MCVCFFHTNTKYSTVEADGIPHGICTHLQYELHPGLEGLGIGLSILLYYLTLDREGGSERRRETERWQRKKREEKQK